MIQLPNLSTFDLTPLVVVLYSANFHVYLNFHFHYFVYVEMVFQVKFQEGLNDHALVDNIGRPKCISE